VNVENVAPAVSTAFNTGCAASCTVTSCSCTRLAPYWSSSTYQDAPPYAWAISFADGFMNGLNKGSAPFVRAVRGGW
jgi:hypothetical protein